MLRSLLSLSGMPPKTPASPGGADPLAASSDDLQITLEAVKAREAKAAKRDKELKARADELDRKQKIIDDTEEKLGTFAQRDVAFEQRDKELNAIQKQNKKRDAALKELEAALQVRQEKCEETELQLDKRRDAAREREAKIEAKEKEIKEADDHVHRRRLEVRQREDECKVLEAQLETRRKELKTLAAEIEERSSQAKAAGDVAKRHEAQVKMREESADALQVRGKNLVAQAEKKEKEVAAERTRLEELSRQLKAEETRQQKELRMLTTMKDDAARRITVAESQETVLVSKKAEHQDEVSKLQAQREALQQSIAATQRYEAEVRQAQQEVARAQEDLVQRERKLAAGQKDIHGREMVAKLKEKGLAKSLDEVQAMQRTVDSRTAAVAEREDAVTLRERKVEKLHKQCLEMEQQTQRRMELLDKKEKDLVDWMKEMEWREMMLGQREDLVKRQPVVVGADAFGAAAADATKHKSARSAVGEEGFSHRAFGHAVVSVQFQRLKDQYISAQMKHARAELSAEAQRQQNNMKRKRRPRAGITVTHGTTDIAEDAEDLGNADELHAEVHHCSVAFVRQMAQLRAFDGFEDPTSPEKLEHLDFFNGNEKTVLCMTANIEYILRSFEDFLSSLRKSPLDEKEKAADLQDLVNRTTQWWRRTTKAVQKARLVLLRDRLRFLQQALGVLHNNPHTKKHFKNVDGDSTGDAHKHIADSLPSAGGAEYVASSHYTHIKESKILAPRGLATLRAVSAAHGSGSPPPEDRALVTVHSPSRHASPSRPMTAPIDDSGAGSFAKQASQSVDLCLIRAGKNPCTKVPSHMKPFDLATTPTLQPVHSSPYAVPPVKSRPSSRASGTGARARLAAAGAGSPAKASPHPE